MPGMELGIDLGTSQVVITAAGRGILLREPAVLAVDEASGRLIACGREAYAMQGRAPASIQVIRPMAKGVISDYDIAERMLKYMVGKICAYKVLKPRAAVSVPAAVTEVEQRSVVEAVTAANVRRVILMEEAVARGDWGGAGRGRGPRLHGRRSRRRHGRRGGNDPAGRGFLHLGQSGRG